MSKVLVEDGYRIVLPAEVQSLAPVGSPILVTIDPAGRIILTPELQLQAVLQETFGMWADRDDLPADGVAYMDEIRQG
jgi:hypothetical protein